MPLLVKLSIKYCIFESSKRGIFSSHLMNKIVKNNCPTNIDFFSAYNSHDLESFKKNFLLFLT